MLKDVSLKRYNTFGIDVKADWLAKIDSVEQVLTIIDDMPDIPKLILGEGSNVLFLNDFKGIVLHNNIKGIKIVDENDREIIVDVNGGENWHNFVMWAVTNGFGGIENLALIPGKAGTAPMQNIGAYGMEVKDVIISVDTVNMQTCEPKTFSKEACDFGYRHSVFKLPENKGRYFIHKVRFKLFKKNYRVNTSYGAIQSVLQRKHILNPGLIDVAEAVMDIRRSKLPDPAVTGNAGSFFKNPFISTDKLKELQKVYPQIPFYTTEKKDIVKIPAGWLIDKAGWKDKRFGDAGVHPKQALVLVNYGNATGMDIKNLADQIISDILEKYDILLQPEVNFIGG